MKKSKKSRITSILICSVLLVLTGCGKEKVNLDEDENTPSDVIMENEKKTEYFDENFQCNEFTVDIDAEFEVPNLSNINTYRASAKHYNEIEKKEIVDKLAKGTIYDATYDNLPQYVFEQDKKQLEYIVDMWSVEPPTAAEEQIYKDNYEFFKGEYETLLEKIEAHPESWSEATDYSCEGFMFKYNSLDYKINFYDRGFSFEPVSWIDYICSMDIKYAEADNAFLPYAWVMDEDETMDAAAEYIEVAECFAGELLGGDFMAVGTTDFIIVYDDYDVEPGNTTDHYVVGGKKVTLFRNLDGYAVDGGFYENWRRYPEEALDDTYDSFEQLNIYVNDEMGIVSVEYNGALNVEENVGKVENVLDFEKIKTVIIDYLSTENRYQYYDYNMETGEWMAGMPISDYNNFEFCYIRVKGDKDGSYTIVPAWKLTDEKTSSMDIHGTAFNAIDGSTIFMEKEIYGD